MKTSRLGDGSVVMVTATVTRLGWRIGYKHYLRVALRVMHRAGVKKQGTVSKTCNPMLGRQRKVGPWGLKGSLAYVVSFRPVRAK